MGYIDSDAHVVECDHTWDFFDPGEKLFKPVITGSHWEIEDLCMKWPLDPVKRWMTEVFPAGAVDLSNPSARVRYMDELGIDVHVMFPTFCLNTELTNPIAQAAMSRSYNRWLAEATSDSGGRLAWALDAPVRTMDRCLEELEFGKQHGAVTVFVRALGHGRSLSDPALVPMYEKAQELDLPISVHVGGDWRSWKRAPGVFLHSAIMPVPGALWTILIAGLPKKFPRLRWAFLEAGASWLPFVLQETFRADETGAARSFKDWRVAAVEALEEQQIYVSAQMDDDLPYLLKFAGEDRLVHGTDFGHLDLGSDPNGLHIIANRPDIDRVAARKIVDDNGRRLYGIDPDFQPAPPPTIEGAVLKPGMAAAHS